MTNIKLYLKINFKNDFCMILKNFIILFLREFFNNNVIYVDHIHHSIE